MDLKKELDLAIKAAKDAGKFLKNSKNSRILSSKYKDIKLEADKEAEKIILKHLEKSSHNILSEESGLIKKDSKYCWIVDPLDGSLNFSRGISLCVVSIALYDKFTPLLGVIYDFNRDELFFGTANQGAWLNKSKISVSKIDKKENAVLCTGFPSFSDYSKKNILNFIKNIQEFKKIRLLGSAALSLCYLALGRSEAYSEKGIMFWDVAAGLALVKFAGGDFKIEKTKDGKNFSYNVFASNGKIDFH